METWLICTFIIVLLIIYIYYRVKIMKKMTNIENFQNIVDEIFGEGKCSTNLNHDTNNHITAGLNSQDKEKFKNNFKDRLSRLNKIYASHSKFNELMTTVKEIANDKNWEGAYAEIVAYDFLNSDNNWLADPIDLEVTKPAAETLAQELGKTNANFDGYYQDFDILFDVKVLSDKSGILLKGIISEAIKSTNSPVQLIIPEYPMDIEFDIFENNRRGLVNELKNILLGVQSPTYIKSTIIPELKYRLLWNQTGALMTENTYAPYLHALNHHTLLFKHIKKFSKQRPSLIIFVVFPWFSESVVTNSLTGKEAFFRAITRRFFMQYKHLPDQAQSMFPSYSNSQDTIYDITKKLSGVIFLIDNSITKDETDQQYTEGYVYLNPNADHPISRGYMIDYFNCLGMKVEDFIYDNY